jgi:dopamine beta-monooxygenase
MVLALGAITAAASGAEARAQRVGQIPNGGVAGCASCHTSAAGGGPRNVFGQMVEADFLSSAGFSGRVQWGPELAKLDADGDGFTNGQELGDPEGTWKTGDADPGGAAAVTHPGDAQSHPEPPVVSAVEATTWAQVKAAVTELFE